MENKQSGKLITILLGVLLVVVLGYAYYSNSENQQITIELEAEKAEIKTNLDDMITRYDAELAKGTSLKAKLTAARQDIVTYRDSLVNQKKTSYQLIKNSKNRVYSLRAKNKELFAKVEALLEENKKLNNEIVVAKEEIAKQGVANAALASENTTLKGKVAIGAVLNISNMSAVAMKKLSSGALKETNRYRKADALRISFKINKNELTLNGDKPAYFVIKDEAGTVVSPKGKVTINAVEVYYSDTTVIDYQNIDTEVIIITDVDRKTMNKGTYTISAFLDGKAVGNTSLTLKESFLGVF